MSKTKIVIFVFIVLIITASAAIFFFFRSRQPEHPTYTFGDPVTSQEKEQKVDGISEEYYKRLAEKCKQRVSFSCCMASVGAMEAVGAKLAPGDTLRESGCPEGTESNMMRCPDSFRWCHPLGNDGKSITVAQQIPPSTPTTTQSPAVEQVPVFPDWKIYRSDMFEFEFQYPQDWEVRDFTSRISDEYVGFYGVGPQSIREDTIWNIGITGTSLDQEVERQKRIITNNINQELVLVTDVQMFERRGKKISQRNKTTGEVYSIYYIENEGRTYSIPADTTNTDAIYQTSRRITDTFKFVK